MVASTRRWLLLAAVVVLGACGGASAGRALVDTTTTTAAPPTTAAPTTTTPPTTAPPTTAPPTTAPPTTAPPAPVDDGTLRPGEAGDEVLALQHRLLDLGYWLGEPDGTYGRLTEQAVMAFQKAEGLARDGIAGPSTQAALAVAGRPVARDPGADGLEIDLARQLLLVVAGGEVRWALNTSTGTSGWRTPPGTFAIDREIDGLRRAPLGDLYRPKYFNGGIAVHGSPSIPGYPASHGCARLSNPAMDLLWSSGVAAVGTQVRVY